MAVTNYYTVNGMLIGEKTTGSNRIDYLTDALGNITATVDQSANIINTYRYKPFGGLLAKTGAGADPAFQWVGNQGYRQTGKSYADVYFQTRHYSSTLGQWTTQDPEDYLDNWFDEAQLSPVNPTSSGLKPPGSPPPSSQPKCRPDAVGALLTIFDRHAEATKDLCDAAAKAWWTLSWRIPPEDEGKLCHVYQYQKGIIYQGKYRRKTIDKWTPDGDQPYWHTCRRDKANPKNRPQTCDQVDLPGPSGIVMRYEKSKDPIKFGMHMDFVTCLCGTDTKIYCYKWHVNLVVDYNNCKVVDCSKSDPVRINPRQIGLKLPSKCGK